MVDVHAIAQHYGGKVCKGNALIPTPGHSSRDRGTAITFNPSAPDGVLVAVYNGTTADALAVKDMLRRDGFIPTDGERNARELTPAERAAIVEAELTRHRERLALERMAATAAATLWNSARTVDPAHPYLVAKSLRPFGIRQQGDALLVPMFDASFRLWNVQRILRDGIKLFMRDGRTAGLFWPHGVHMLDGKPTGGPLVIGEGFATMAAIHMATGHGVVAAMSARNLENVARAMRKLFPNRQIVIAADDDSHLSENLGLNAARKAAQAVGGHVSVPLPLDKDAARGVSGTDFADIPRDQVAVRLAAALLGA